jgi:hypothetical protein
MTWRAAALSSQKGQEIIRQAISDLIDADMLRKVVGALGCPVIEGIKDRVFVITGASSGLGAGTA